MVTSWMLTQATRVYMQPNQDSRVVQLLATTFLVYKAQRQIHSGSRIQKRYFMKHLRDYVDLALSPNRETRLTQLHRPRLRYRSSRTLRSGTLLHLPLYPAYIQLLSLIWSPFHIPGHLKHLLDRLLHLFRKRMAYRNAKACADHVAAMKPRPQ